MNSTVLAIQLENIVKHFILLRSFFEALGPLRPGAIGQVQGPC